MHEPTEDKNEDTTPEWRETLPDDLKEHPTLANVKTIPDLAKALVHAERMVGSDKIAIPGKNATEEEIASFQMKLGRPENPDGYELPGGLPEGVKLDDEAVKGWFKEAHAMGLNKQQAARALRYDALRAESALKQIEIDRVKTREESEQAMRKEFGGAYDQNMGLARNAVQEFGGEELQAYLEETGLGNDPRMIRAFAKVGRMVAEDEIIGGGGGQGFALSPADAKAAIDAKKLDKDFIAAYRDKRNVGHDAAVEEMKRLYNIAYPPEVPVSG